MSNTMQPDDEKPTVQLTIDVPRERLPEFQRLYDAFMAAEPDPGQAVRQRAADRAHGIASLQALVGIAQGDGDHSHDIALFLAGVYNGLRFPLNVKPLRRFDERVWEHCMAVLRLDRYAEKDVDRYFCDSVRALVEQWRLDRYTAVNAAGVLALYLMEGGSPVDQVIAREVRAWRGDATMKIMLEHARLKRTSAAT